MFNIFSIQKYVLHYVILPFLLFILRETALMKYMYTNIYSFQITTQFFFNCLDFANFYFGFTYLTEWKTTSNSAYIPLSYLEV